MGRRVTAETILRKMKQKPNSPLISDNFQLPNNSGDHVRSTKRAAPVDDKDLVNKEYVDVNDPVHWHSKLVAPDGSPNPALLIYNNGNAQMGGNITINKTTISDTAININLFGSGNREASLNLIGDTTYPDGGLEIIRNNTGANAISEIVHRGTGILKIGGSEACSVELKTNNTIRLTIASSGSFNFGSNDLTAVADFTMTGTPTIPGLTDNTICNTLHRHSELVSSDGSPDPAFSINADGNAYTPYYIQAVNGLIVGSGQCYIYDSATNVMTFRTGTAAALKYFNMEIDGYFNCLSGGINAAGIITATEIIRSQSATPGIWMDETGAGNHGAFLVLDGNIFQIQRRAQSFGAWEASPFQIYIAAPTDSLIMGANGNIGLNIYPATSAAIDITSTTKALLLSRMTTVQRDALTAINGMIIYNTTTNAFNFYENGAWVSGSGLV